jgi:(2Fe-2S) ferredoxin
MGADGLVERAETWLAERDDDDKARIRLLRGGCYGLCDISANVVVRRWASPEELPDTEADRLKLSGLPNETIYSRTEPDGLAQLLRSHLEDDEASDELTLEARQSQVPPRSKTAEKIRRLRGGGGARGKPED